MTSEEREKETLRKMHVLKQALISERQKNSILENEIKHLKSLNVKLENEVEKKDKEIIKQSSEKNNLIQQLDFYRHKK